MVLIDTSAWIEFFNGTEPIASQVQNLVNNNEVALCPIVWTEVLQGIRDDNALNDIKFFFEGFENFDNAIMTVAEKAVSIYRTLRKNGVTIRKSNNCMIAAYAILNNVPILQKDRDFEMMAKHISLVVI